MRPLAGPITAETPMPDRDDRNDLPDLRELRDLPGNDDARVDLDEPEWLADNDSPWKDLIDAEFEDFLHFFAPVAAADVDWSHAPVSLDAELQALSIGAEHGRRYADKLVRVRRRGGDDVFVLVHVEVQGRRDPHFAARMAGYRRRIESRWDRPVFSMALLVDDSPSWRPGEFIDELWSNRVHFQFHVVKLLDYAPRIDELLASDNAFALAVVAHLRARASRQNPQQRFGWKLELTRMLLARGHERTRIQRLFRFMDWLLILPRALRVQYTDHLIAIREEKRMPYISTYERDMIEAARTRALLEGHEEGMQRGHEEGMQQGMQRGHEEGLQQGLQQGHEEGLQKGQCLVVLRQLERRCGPLDETDRSAVLSLAPQGLEALADAVLDFHDAGDLRRWLAAR